MTTLNCNCTSLILLKVLRVQCKQDYQCYKEMKGHAMIATGIRPQKCWSTKTVKTPNYNAFDASNLRDYVQEGMLYQNIPHADPDHLFFFSQNTKLG